MDDKFRRLIIPAFIAIVELFALAFVFAFLENKFVVTVYNYFESFIEGKFWLTYLAVIAADLIFYLLNKKPSDKELIKGNEGQDDHLMTISEIKRSKDFTYTTFSNLKNVNDGVVLQAQLTANRQDLKIVLTKPIHTLVIGTTGAGKTTGFLNPTIEILANTKTKPSMIISDPKGELYDTHSNRLKELGYNILVIDLREPYKSTRWNPFDILKERIEQVKALQYVSQRADGSIEAAGQIFQDQEQINVRIQELKDEIYENAKDLTETICPIGKTTDEGWQKGARSLINAIVLAFCEDFETDMIAAEQFNLTSLYHTVTVYATGECEQLKKYLYGRPAQSKVRGLAGTVLETSDKTLSSYLSDVNAYAEWLSDNGILSMTSDGELDLYGFDERPTVLFIKVPDERPSRHRLVTLLITQIYKSLVEKANRNKKQAITEDANLQRNCYFLLDEFGNLPKFNNLENIITVGRSRHIYFEMIVQSYAQLNEKYGKEVGQIVKSNCNIKVFLGSDNLETIREISEAIGKKKVLSTNLSSGRGGKEENLSSSESVKEIPLIYPTELARLNSSDSFGNAVCMVFGHYSFRSKFTPSFEAQSLYKTTKGSAIKFRDPVVFDEKAHTYDIEEAMDKKERLINERTMMAIEQARFQKNKERIKAMQSPEQPTQEKKEKKTVSIDKITMLRQYRNSVMELLKPILTEEDHIRFIKTGTTLEKIEFLKQVKIANSESQSLLFPLMQAENLLKELNKIEIEIQETKNNENK